MVHNLTYDSKKSHSPKFTPGVNFFSLTNEDYSKTLDGPRRLCYWWEGHSEITQSDISVFKFISSFGFVKSCSDIIMNILQVIIEKIYIYYECYMGPEKKCTHLKNFQGSIFDSKPYSLGVVFLFSPDKKIVNALWKILG